MANIDYDQCANECASQCAIGGGLGNIGNAYAENYGEPKVYVAHCGGCGHGVYLMEHEPSTCPSCGCLMSRSGRSAPVSALSTWQRKEMSESRERHFQMQHRSIARGQIMQAQPNEKQWGTSSMELMQERVNREAEAVAKQLAKLQQAPARIGNKCAIKAPAQPASPEEQKRAVQHEVLDALDYLIKDILECAERYPQLEALGRNYAMRRAMMAVEHGRAVLC